MKQTLSLSLIVKNEEVHMQRVLENTSLFADEVIIVDTGSTDRTKDIAKQYTPHVYDFQWTDDFAAARNFGLTKCTKDFIMCLDADDVLRDEDALTVREIFTRQPVADIYIFPYYCDFPQNKTIIKKERIFRNTKDLFFSYPLHEYLDTSKDSTSFTSLYVNIPIYHDNLEKISDSPQRNLSIALQTVKKKQYRGDMRAWWMLESAYRGVDNYDFALTACYQAIQKNDKHMLPHQKSNLYLDLGLLLAQKNNLIEALPYLSKSVDIYPHWREPIFVYATTLFKTGDYQNALEMFLRCKNIPTHPYQDICNASIYDNRLVEKWITKTYGKLGRIDSAIFSFFNSFLK